MSGRTAKSVRNIKYAFIGQALGLLISFITRMVFVRTLNIEYLGIDGLFANILLFLSLADMGIGTAVIYSLYKPLVENDTKKMQALMALYKTAFFAIGGTILISGIILIPFIDFFIKEIPNIPHLKLIFLMFVSNTAISYLFAYKRLLIIADQKRYIATLYRYGFYFGLNVLQILVLWVTQEYLLFLSLLLINTLLENIFVARKADQLFPFLVESHKHKLSRLDRSEILKNIKAMSFHKIGGVAVNGSDNILIAKIVGVVVVGIYSNYLLISNALTIVFGLVFQAVTASIGNLTVTDEDKKQSMHIFNVLNFFGFWIYGLTSVMLLNLFNPFINLWLGAEYLFDFKIVLIVVVNFYLQGMRKSVLTFRDAMGLYWYDRYKPILEVVVKVGISIWLGIEFGTIGILLGTTISTLTTAFWIEPFVLYKFGLKTKLRLFFVNYVMFALVVSFTGMLTFQICKLIDDSFIGFLLKTALCIVLTNLIFILFFAKTNEFKHLYGVAIKQLNFLKK